MLCIGVSILIPYSAVNAASVHMTASAPWRSYADPLAPQTGAPVLPAIYDALTLIEDDGTLTPALAVPWRIESDTVWIFKLRPNVVFSDGSELDADAVADCLSFLIGPGGQVYGNRIYIDGIAGVRALSDDEVEVTTLQKDSGLARKLANVNIFSVDAFERLGRTEFAKTPVGTGPFKPESWSSEGNRVVLISVPSSWRKSEQVDRVEIVFIPDSSARLQNVLSGGTDISMNIDPDLIPTIEQAGYAVSVRPGPIYLTMALRTGEDAAEPLRDRRVRLAMNIAIDRESISRYLLRGTMEPATQYATPGILGFDPAIEPYAFDRKRAKKLLAEAGYPNGFALNGMVMTGQFPADTLIFQQVAQDLGTIGVDVELGTLPVIEFIRRRTTNSWDDVDLISSILSSYRMGDISLTAVLFSCSDPRSTFCDPAMDELLERANQEMEPIARGNILRAVNAQLHHAAPAILISRYSLVVALSKRIVKFPEFPSGKMRFEQMMIAEGS